LKNNQTEIFIAFSPAASIEFLRDFKCKILFDYFEKEYGLLYFIFPINILPEKKK